MTSPTPWVYLGPLGRMVKIASPEADIDRSSEKFSSLSESLNGTGTEDTRGFRRTWEIETAYLYQNDLTYLQACFQNVITDPIRIIDPVNRNRLSTSTSAAGVSPAWSNGSKNWKATNGVVTEVTNTDTPVISYTSEDGRAVSYQTGRAIQWAATASGDLYAEAEYRSPTVYPIDMSVPVIPGEQITVSARVRRISGSGTVALVVFPVSQTGVTGTALLSSTTTSASWVTLTYTYTVPASGVASVYLGIRVSAAATVQATMLQLESGAVATTWALGQGCPVVLFRTLEEVSPVYPLVTASMELRER